MKRLFNKYVPAAISCIVFTLSGTAAFSQNSSPSDSGEEQMVLPEVTTTVSGDSLSAGKEAIPDFSDVIMDTDDNQGVLPVLPGVEIYDVPDEPVADLSYSRDSQVYSEGLIGGGYPGYFIGDFSIYQNSGKEPFLLRFSQLTENGYGRHAASEGYFDSDALLLGSKTLVLGDFTLDLKGTYSTSTLGFQSKSDSFYSMTRQSIGTSDDIQWNLPYGFGLSLGTDFSWYSRYSGIIKDASSYTAQEAEAGVLYVAPVFKAFWKNDFLNAGLSAGYNLETFADEMDSETAGTYVVNRGQFMADFSWNNSFLSAGGKAGAVIGTEIGSELPVIPVFELDFSGEWDVSYSPSTIRVNAEGGLKSELPLYENLEKHYLYASQYYLPSETSDWYCNVAVSVPVASVFAIDADVDFSKTAFGNGVWEATYRSSSSNGMYTFQQLERTQFDTTIAFNYAYSLFNLKFDWKSHWIHVPSNENQFQLGLTFNVDSEESVLGADIGIHEALGSGADFVPVIDIGGYYRLQDSLRLAFQVNDAIKLVTGKDRTYCNSMYSMRAGSVTLLIKFFF